MANAKRKIVLGVLGALALTCGSDDVADLLVDAGETLVDAGQALDDALGEGDANADPTEYDLTCDTVYTRTTNYEGGTVYKYTTYHATKDIGASAQSFPDVRVLLCNYQDFADPVSQCPANATCTGQLAPPNDCQLSAGGAFRGGELVVFCGYKQETTYPTNPDQTNGYRWNSVKVQVR